MREAEAGVKKNVNVIVTSRTTQERNDSKELFGLFDPTTVIIFNRFLINHLVQLSSRSVIITHNMYSRQRRGSHPFHE